MTNILKAALEASEMGFPVFPADPNTKRPLVKDWPHVATRDPEKIKQFWLQFPNSMIGAVTGHASGWVAIDIDIKENESAFQKLKTFENLHGEKLKPAFCTETGSKGLHLFFPLPNGIDIKNSASKIGQGWDVRSTGGYVIFAGSIRSDGNSYKFINFEEAYNAS